MTQTQNGAGIMDKNLMGSNNWYDVSARWAVGSTVTTMSNQQDLTPLW